MCGVDSPGWEVIAQASNDAATPTGFLCNYRVLRTDVRLSDGKKVNLGESGVAITIAYFCTPEEGRERYTGVAGARTTETYRDDSAGILITEEGPLAKNPTNPQSKGIFSSFFVDSNGVPIARGLQEKEWRLLSPQVFATIVVLTDERGKVPETDRFGVDQAEVVARELANRSRSAAGCNIPEVGAGPTATETGGGLPVNVIMGAGGIAVVVIGGYTVWKRRPGKPGKVAPKVASQVPEQCRGIATLYDDQVQVITTLREAEADLRQQLERAEKIHSNNIIKAKMVVNLEIISAFGGTATDLALALRPTVLRRVGPGAIGQQDTWKPPGSIGAKWAEQIRRAQAAATTAWAKLHTVKNDIEFLIGRVAQKVDDLPTVKNAKRMLELNMNRLGEMFTDLPKANELRRQLTQLEHQGELLAAERAALKQRMTPVQARLSDLQTKLNNARNVLAAEQGLLPQDLKAAEDALASLVARGVEDTAVLGKAQDTVERFRGQLQRASSGAEARKALADAKDLEAAIAKETDLLNPLLRQEEVLGKKSTDLVGKRQQTFGELETKLNNLTSADLDLQGRIVGRAQGELDAAVAEGHAQVGQELTKRRAEQQALEVEAASIQGHLDELRAQAEQDTLRSGMGTPTDGGGIVSAIGKAIWWASAPIRYPLTIAGELVLGVGQSPQEIMEILLQGRTNIQTLRSHLGAVTRGAFDQQRKINTVRRRLDDCVKGKAVKGVDVPANTGARAA